MLTVFEVHFGEKADIAGLLSPEVQKETHAQVMTVEQARQVGFKGLPDLGPNVRLIAVNKRDARWIQNVLEASQGVERFNVHHVD
ncbi:MAG: hypothetical protein U0271_08695 [Polyangiaceae bacterium]